MPLELILDLVLVFAVLAMLLLFLRRLPEVMEAKGQLKISELAEPEMHKERLTLGRIAKKIWISGARKIWLFMLEAKDLRQGQALATKFIEIVPAKKAFNIGALSALKRANRLDEAGDLEEAERAYLAVIKKHPHEFGAYEGLVKIYTQQKNFSEVQQLLEYLIRHNPTNDGYMTQLGATLMRRRRFREAISAYEQALKIHDLVAVRYVNIALCYQAMNDLGQARHNFQKALDLEPANVQYLMLLVDLLLKQDSREEARELLLKGIEINPDSAELREKLKDFQGAAVL